MPVYGRAPASGGKGDVLVWWERREEAKARSKQEVRNIGGQGGQLEKSFHDPSVMRVRVD